MSWNIGDNRKQFLSLKTKVGLYHVVLTKPRNFSQKTTLTVVKMQQLPDVEEMESKADFFCLK